MMWKVAQHSLKNVLGAAYCVRGNETIQTEELWNKVYIRASQYI